MDDNFRRRTNLHDGSHRRGTEEKKSGGMGLTGFQIVICLLCILAASVIRLMGGSVYRQTQSVLSQALASTNTGSQIAQVFGPLKKYWQGIDVKSVFAASSSGPSASGSSGTGSSAGSAAASGSSGSSAAASSSASSAVSSSASSAASKASSSSAVSSKSVAPTADMSLNPTGAVRNTDWPADGTETLAPAVASDGTLAAPKNVSLGPYLLTVTPIWPATGRISSGFGYRNDPFTGKLAFHTGLDIAAAENTPIRAALPGTVETSASSGSYGNYLVIRDGEGVATLYAHCETLLVKAGDVVKQGDEIAKVGTTGESTGYHLHFEIRIGGVEVDPAWALPGASDVSIRV